MVQQLLDGLSVLEEFTEPPEEIASQFMSWLTHVAAALNSAGMSDELKIWNEAAQKVSFVPEESSFAVQILSFKAILLGMLESISGGNPSDDLLAIEIVDEAPTYVQRIAVQANGCFERGWYDGCAVMMRRLIETLIIECFEKHGLEAQIRDDTDNYVRLADLISRFLAQSWHISRNTKGSLPKLRGIKDTGDLAAHSRRFLTTRQDIERFATDFRVVVQELVYIAGMGKNVAPSS
jgi:hypothetical protein